MKSSNFKENLYIFLVVFVLVACMVGASFLTFFYSFDFDNKAKVASADNSGGNVLQPLTMVELTMPDIDYDGFEVTTRYIDNADAMAHAYIYPDTWFIYNFTAVPDNAVIAYYQFSIANSPEGLIDPSNNVDGAVYGYSYTTSTSTAFNRYQCGWYNAGYNNYSISQDVFRWCYSPQLSFAVGKEYEGMPSAYFRLDKVRVYYYISDSYVPQEQYQDIKDKYDILSQGLDYSLYSNLTLETMIPLPNAVYKNASYTYDGSTFNGLMCSGRSYLHWNVGLPVGANFAVVWDLIDSTYFDSSKYKPCLTFMTILDAPVAGGSMWYYKNYDLSSMRSYGTIIDVVSKYQCDSIFIGFCPYDFDFESTNKFPYGSSIAVDQSLFVSNFSLKVRNSDISALLDQYYNNGVSEGEKQGYDKGYNVGYGKGVNDAGEYTFMGLIGAVVDAPVSAFRQMFNFEVLGVNLSSFFMAMLTACLIIVIIRIVLGGK